jgi:hypothetical protein
VATQTSPAHWADVDDVMVMTVVDILQRQAKGRR